MINLKDDFNNFLFYLEKLRGDASSSIATYDIVLDITPLRLKNIYSSKESISSPKPIDKTFITKALKHSSVTEHLIISLLYGFGLRILKLSTLRTSNIFNKLIRVKRTKRVSF